MMNDMKLPGEEETGGGVGPSLIYMVIGVSAFVLIVLFAVFQGNDNKRGGSEYLQEMCQRRLPLRILTPRRRSVRRSWTGKGKRSSRTSSKTILPRTESIP